MLTDFQRYRMYEMLPGLLVWGTLIGSITLSFIRPVWVLYFIILFDVYWVLKASSYIFYLGVSWFRFSKVRKVDWKDTLFHTQPNWKDIHHVVFLTIYNEDWSIAGPTIERVCNAAYDKESMVVVIAGEARAKENFESILKKARETYGHKVHDIVGTCHPHGLKGEIPGKASNLHHAEKEMKAYIDKKGWNYAKIVVTVFDIDAMCHLSYFAYLTCKYLDHPNPTRSSFQPVPLYNNNIWDSPAILRIMAFGTSFWTMMMLARQDALMTFSSYSLSYNALVDIGFHDPRIISEDARLFYQCFLRYDGNYEVTPLYVPVSMDTVRDDSTWKSIKNLYKQQRRWAWGMEQIPYLLWEFRKKGKTIPLWKKVKWLFVEWEGKWTWCVAAIIITVLGQLPFWVAGDAVRQSALFFNTPQLLQRLMGLAMLALLLSAALSFPLLPKRPESHPRHRYIIMLLQWILMPISLIIVSAIPAIDAVTRLMFGKYLGYEVAQKNRKT